MGTFTIPLKKVIEMEGDLGIGLNDYPIFQEGYRESLNQKIINHYWNQEIGLETNDLFRFAMRRKMHEIMPLYNQHYELSLKTVDPLSTVHISDISDTSMEATSNSTSNNTSASGAKSRAVASDFPQVALQEGSDYASTAQDNISDTTATADATGNDSSNQSGNSTHTQDGYQGHAPLLILQARQALVNVDMMVIDELKELFMLIWANGDDYTGSGSYYGLY